MSIVDTIATVFGESLAVSQPALVTRHSIRENRRQLHILLAEDNLVNHRLATRMLEKRGHSVFVAENGKKAIAALEKEAFDIVLMDVQIPEMDGLEATAVIRQKENETGKHVPIVAMTARAMVGDREKCLKAGMDDYVTKPIKSEEVFKVIEGPLTASVETEKTFEKDREEELEEKK